MVWKVLYGLKEQNLLVTIPHLHPLLHLKYLLLHFLYLLHHLKKRAKTRDTCLMELYIRVNPYQKNTRVVTKIF